MKKLSIFLILSLLFSSLGFAELQKKTQKGIGTVDIYDSHGTKLYRFVPKEPNNDELRFVKLHFKRMGFKKGYPEEMEAFLKEAVEEEKEVEIECEFLDKGAEKTKTSIGIKLISYKFVE